jgi:putative ABC transport system ATP-binding protein
MIETTEISFSYSPGRVFHYPALRPPPGLPLLVTGRSGTGKTTLLHLLAGLLRPHSGSIRIQDQDMNQLNDRALDRFRGRQIGLVFQRPHFVESLSMRENIGLPIRWSGEKASAKTRVEELAEALGIAHVLGSKPARLSQGELQRAAIARALINRPGLLLADEPTSALDDDNCRAAVNLLLLHSNQNQSQLVVVTHDNRLTHQFNERIHLS